MLTKSTIASRIGAHPNPLVSSVVPVVQAVKKFKQLFGLAKPLFIYRRACSKMGVESASTWPDRLHREFVSLPKAPSLPILERIDAVSQPTNSPNSTPPSTSLG